MTAGKIKYGIVPSELISADPIECASRLGMPIGEVPPMFEDCLKELKSVIMCKYSAVRCSVTYSDESSIEMPFGTIMSKALRKNLDGCAEVFIFAVTIGIGVDRLISRHSLTSSAKCFTIDAIASALAESACDLAESQIRDGVMCRPRFSPGYADLSLEVQPSILELLQAQRLLGITLDNSLLMTPRKSITAIMGII